MEGESRPLHRRFKLLHLMGWIAVAAAAMVIDSVLRSSIPDYADRFDLALRMILGAANVLFVVSLIAVGLPIARNGRQGINRPGAAAGVAVVAATALLAAQVVVIFWSLGARPFGRQSPGFLAEWIVTCVRWDGLAVVGAWATQIASGRWRPVATWTDRLGIAVGLAWIGAALGGRLWF